MTETPVPPAPEPAADPTGGPPPRLAWQSATVLAVRPETPTARTIRLRLPQPFEHLAGQHVVVRLTAPDGYTASRSYSIASAPDGGAEIELTIERLADGEVSTYLADVLEPGDELELRGPIGGWFAWRGDDPVLLVGGGSGVVPLAAMLRLARAEGRSELVRMLVSARTADDIYYSGELFGGGTTTVLTRQTDPVTGRPPGRITAADLAPLIRGGETVFVCGSPGFADTVTDALIGLGVGTDRIRVERFGPSG